MNRSCLAALLLLPFAASCSLFGGKDAAPEPMPAPSAPPAPRRESGWRAMIRDADHARLRNWRDAWTIGLTKARKSGNGARILAQGALLQPDAALTDPTPPPGEYRCRAIKLGAQSEGLLDYVAYPYFSCRITPAGDALSFMKVDGSQRPVGMIYPDQGTRMVFLGTMLLGDEPRAMAYGDDIERDLPGLVERVGPRQWRLVLPYPRWESMIDILELIPKN